MKRFWRKEIPKIIGAALLFCTLIVLAQDVLIFPWLLYSPTLPHPDPKAVDPKLESSFVTSADGTAINVWYYPAAREPNSDKHAAIIFRGNGGFLNGFFFVQQWFSAQGIPSYIFDYRGYGESEGWPSEAGIYADAEAVWEHVVKRESISPQKIILFGLSIGTGPAAFLAEKKQVGTLLLVSPYTSIPDLARETSSLGFLSPFLWYSFAVKEFLPKLDNTCLVIAHGKKDVLIPYSHGEKLQDLYRGKKGVSFIGHAEADHNNVFFYVEQELKTKLQACLAEG